MPAKRKHLSEEDRFIIEQGLRSGKSLLAIAREIGRPHSTVAREILRHRFASNKNPYRGRINTCKNRRGCIRRHLCADAANCNRLCRTCGASCRPGGCDCYEEDVCERIARAPYVCNGCRRQQSCTLRKVLYTRKRATEDYRRTLVGSRRGMNLDPRTVEALNAVLVPGLNRGQSVYHIMRSNPNLFPVSEKTVYRYINLGYLVPKRHNLPMAMRYRKRKSRGREHKVDRQCLVGRTYERFLEFRRHHRGASIVEMDTVEGATGGKVLTTFSFTASGFMVAFLQDGKFAQNVIDSVNRMWDRLGRETFERIFQAILTDNGTEFSNPSAIEHDPDGNARTRVFYCRPYTAADKPHVERNHEFIRKVLLKGASFDDLTQDDVDTMMSHINSYKRESLKGRSPYERFAFEFGDDVPEKLGIRKIEANAIVLRPELLQD